MLIGMLLLLIIIWVIGLLVYLFNNEPARQKIAEVGHIILFCATFMLLWLLLLLITGGAHVAATTKLWP